MLSNDELREQQQRQQARVAGNVGIRDPRREADYVAAAAMERRGDLAMVAPAAAACWSLLDSVGHAIAVDPVTLQRASDEMTTAEAVDEFYFDPSRHSFGAGIVTGVPRVTLQLGTFTIIALQAHTWTDWFQWERAHCGERRVINERLTTEERRFSGEAVVATWTATANPPLRRASFGPSGMTDRQALATLAAGMAGDRGGWLLWWLKADVDGRLSKWERRALGTGLVVLEPGAAVPLALERDGLRVTLGGSLTGAMTSPLERWLADLFGVRWPG